MFSQGWLLYYESRTLKHIINEQSELAGCQWKWRPCNQTKLIQSLSLQSLQAHGSIQPDAAWSLEGDSPYPTSLLLKRNPLPFCEAIFKDFKQSKSQYCYPYKYYQRFPLLSVNLKCMEFLQSWRMNQGEWMCSQVRLQSMGKGIWTRRWLENIASNNLAL